MAIALPLLLLFGGLFAAADAQYEAILTGLVDWKADDLLSHFLGSLICAWIAVGLIRVALWVDEPAKSADPKGQGARLGITELAVVLAALNALFLTFVLVQIPYFFGGPDRVIDPSGPTFAEYARRGFFELVAVTALVLPLLLLAHGWLRKEDRRHELLFRLLAGALIAQLFVIMTSAFHRMLLSQSAYGLTELRLYVTAFMGWLAALFLWFAATVLRGRRDRFAFGAMAAAFVALALLNRLNPDAFIAEANAGRAQTARRFDVRYVTSLSADAVPALIEALPALSDGQRRPVARAVLARWSPPPARDWRTWNWGREQAWAAVEANKEMLRQMAGSPEVVRGNGQ